MNIDVECVLFVGHFEFCGQLARYLEPKNPRSLHLDLLCRMLR